VLWGGLAGELDFYELALDKTGDAFYAVVFHPAKFYRTL